MHVLRNEEEYEAAIEEIEGLLDKDGESGSEGHDRLEFLSVLVEHYEEEHYPMGNVTPQQAVTFMLEQKGMSRSRRFIDGSASRLTSSWVWGGESRRSPGRRRKRRGGASDVQHTHRRTAEADGGGENPVGGGSLG